MEFQPQFNAGVEEGFTTLVGESTFYQRYEHFSDIEWAVREAQEDEELEEESGYSGEKSFEVVFVGSINFCHLKDRAAC